MQQKKWFAFWVAFWPVIHIICILPASYLFVWIAQSYPENSFAESLVWLLPLAHFGVMVDLLFGVAFFNIDAGRRSSLNRKSRFKWQICLGLFAIISMPLYWLLIYRQCPRENNGFAA